MGGKECGMSEARNVDKSLSKIKSNDKGKTRGKKTFHGILELKEKAVLSPKRRSENRNILGVTKRRLSSEQSPQ
jgi:hypothetical protein